MQFTTEQKKAGFKKEGSRGIGESAPDKFLAVSADSNIDYTAAVVEDEKIRGIPERFPSAPGVKAAAGTLTVDLEASSIGDLLLGCLGQVVTTQPDPTNAPSVFQHAFSRLASPVLPSFTFFLDRGMNVKRYPLGIIKKLAFTGAVDGKAQVAFDVAAKTEEDASQFAADFGAPKPLMFFQTDFQIAGVPDTNVRSWSLNIDNQAEAIRTLNQSRDAREILAKARTLVDGGFEIYFEAETERQRLLDSLSQGLKIILTGEEIEGGLKNKLLLDIPGAKYTAFPFGDLDGLLGAAVTFNGEFLPAAGKSIEAILTNIVTSF